MLAMKCLPILSLPSLQATVEASNGLRCTVWGDSHETVVTAILRPQPDSMVFSRLFVIRQARAKGDTRLASGHGK